MHENPWRPGRASLAPCDPLVRALFEEVPALVLHVDDAGIVLRMSRDMEIFTGWSSELAAGRHISEFVDAEDREAHQAEFERCLNTGAATRFEHTYALSGGRQVHCAWRLVPLDEGVLAVAREVGAPDDGVLARLDERRQRSDLDERFYQSVVNAQSDLIVRVDPDHRFTFVNDAYCRLFGKTREELLGRSFTPLVHQEDLAPTLAAMEALRRPPHWCELEQRAWTVDGWRWIAWQNQAIVDEDGAIVEVQGVGRDITHLKDAEALSREVSDLAGVARWDFDYVTERLRWSDAVHALFETDPASFRPTYERFMQFVHPHDREVVDDANRAAALERQGYDIEHRVITARGSLRWVHQRAAIRYGHDGLAQQAVGVIQDVTLRKFRDALTDLPNQAALVEHVQAAVNTARETGRSCALCLLGIDRFTRLNARYGRNAGDRALIAITERLQAMMRDGDVIARVFGDQFGVLVNALRDPSEAQRISERLLRAFASPFDVEGHVIRVSASIGVAAHPLDDTSPETLWGRAQRALHSAKRAGGDRVTLHDPVSEREHVALTERRERLRHALERAEFVLHYQPMIDLLDGRLIGAEALTRWQHPVEGLLSPAQFLPDMLGSDHECAFGQWVVQAALAQWQRWRHAGVIERDDAILSVNVSARHLLSDDFAAHVRQALERHPQVPPSSLQIEVVETSTLVDVERARRVLAQCRDLGVSVALDDFGTGYSSLAHVRELPFDVIKLDRSFVQNMLDRARDLAIASTVISLGQAFNRMVVAEGVETLEQAAALRALGCRAAQGFSIARPLDPPAFADWTERWSGQRFTDELARRLVAPVEGLTVWVALKSHTRWVRRVLEILEDPAQLGPLGGPDECDFGAWYFGEGSGRYAGEPDYVALEAEHDEIHEVAEALVERLRGEGMVDETLERRFRELHQRISERLERLGVREVVSAGG